MLLYQILCVHTISHKIRVLIALVTNPFEIQVDEDPLQRGIRGEVDCNSHKALAGLSTAGIIDDPGPRGLEY